MPGQEGGDQGAHRGEVVAALLDQHGRQVEAAEHLPGGPEPVRGHPERALGVVARAPRRPPLSVRLCDVFPDGTSALVARGTVDPTLRAGFHATPEAIETVAARDGTQVSTRVWRESLPPRT